MSDVSSQSARRAAVYLALREHLDGDALWQALYMWQCDYADKPRFAIAGFVRAVAAANGIKGGALHRALTRNTLTDLNGSAVDPIDELRAFVAFNGLVLPDSVEVGVVPASASATPEPPAAAPGAVGGLEGAPATMPLAATPASERPDAVADSVFTLLTDTMRKLCRETTAGDAAFSSAFGEGNMDGAHRALVERWWLEGHWRASPVLGLADQRQVINALYRTLCDLVGPVVADRQFGRALDMVERRASDPHTLRDLL
ncbi:MAG: hypothetical protein AAF458_11220 [Pseudomonadota bacterium]